MWLTVVRFRKVASIVSRGIFCILSRGESRIAAWMSFADLASGAPFNCDTVVSAGRSHGMRARTTRAWISRYRVFTRPSLYGVYSWGSICKRAYGFEKTRLECVLGAYIVRRTMYVCVRVDCVKWTRVHLSMRIHIYVYAYSNALNSNIYYSNIYYCSHLYTIGDTHAYTYVCIN